MAHPEALLISSVLRTGNYTTPVHRGISNRLFHLHQDEWRWLERYTTKWKRTPSKVTFKAKFPEFQIKAVDDVEHFIEEVKREHARYLLSETIDDTITLLESDDIEEAVKLLHGAAINLQVELQGDAVGELDLIEDWSVLYDEVKRRMDKRGETGLAGVPTGFPTLDDLTGGPQAGDFWVIAARLGVGKTWTLIRMGAAALFSNHHLQYDALEQTSVQVGMRFHTFISSKHGKQVFRALDLTKGENIDLLSYRKWLANLKKRVGSRIKIADQRGGRITPMTIAAQIERNKPDVLFLDYLTLVEGEKDWQAVAKLSNEIKSLAQRYAVPIVAAAQINRTGEGKEPPRANHIAIADAIGQDADCVVTMMKPSQHVMKFRLAKFRNGEDDEMWWCKFTPNTGQFDEISGDRARELISEDQLED